MRLSPERSSEHSGGHLPRKVWRRYSTLDGSPESGLKGNRVRVAGIAGGATTGSATRRVVVGTFVADLLLCIVEDGQHCPERPEHSSRGELALLVGRAATSQEYEAQWCSDNMTRTSRGVRSWVLANDDRIGPKRRPQAVRTSMTTTKSRQRVRTHHAFTFNTKQSPVNEVWSCPSRALRFRKVCLRIQHHYYWLLTASHPFFLEAACSVLALDILNHMFYSATCLHCFLSLTTGSTRAPWIARANSLRCRGCSFSRETQPRALVAAASISLRAAARRRPSIPRPATWSC